MIRYMKKNYVYFTLKITLFSLFITQTTRAQQHHYADFITADSNISFDIANRKVIGKVDYTFEVKRMTDTIYIDAKNMDIKGVNVNNKKTNFVYDNKQIKIYEGYQEGKNTLQIGYETVPKQALYFVGVGGEMQVWTQGQGKYTSHWLPSFDDYNEKVIFNTTITFDSDYQVIANGLQSGKKTIGKQTQWTYKMNKPMSSYLAMLAIGKFTVKTEKAQSGITLENYLRPQDADKYASTYLHNKRIFDFLESEIGVAYPWGGIYRNIPIDDFMYGGMENTTSTIYTQDYVVDKIGLNDQSFLNVNAHEMAHQWFGDLITAEKDEDHWLQEGFATYYALLAEKEVLGDNYYFWKLYQLAEELQIDSQNNGNTVILSKGATTPTYYKKGAWALFALNTQIGRDNFRKAVQNYLNKYAYKNVSTNQFLDEIEAVSPNFNRERYEMTWLKSNSFPVKDAVYLLQNSPLISEYMALLELHNQDFATKKDTLWNILQSTSFSEVKQEVIFQLHEVPYDDAKDFYDYVAQSKDIKLRQALVKIIAEIPEQFIPSYKKFLLDESYITREMVMKNWWIRLENDRKELLDKTKNYIGFNDRNLRITWLMLALATEDYSSEQKANWYTELKTYSTSRYNGNTRQNAIQAMWFLNEHDSNVLPQLSNALIHHDNRFKSFGKTTIQKLIERKEYREFFENLLPYLPNNEKAALENVLK